MIDCGELGSMLLHVQDYVIHGIDYANDYYHCL